MSLMIFFQFYISIYFLSFEFLNPNFKFINIFFPNIFSPLCLLHSVVEHTFLCWLLYFSVLKFPFGSLCLLFLCWDIFFHVSSANVIIFKKAALKSLSENSNICVNLVLASTVFSFSLFLSLKFSSFCYAGDFQWYPEHINMLRLWILFKFQQAFSDTMPMRDGNISLCCCQVGIQVQAPH